MKRQIHLLILLLGGCATTQPIVEGPILLGDSERTMVAKMNTQGARDVTRQTSYTYYAAISLDQRYYWWELPDKTIVAVLVAAAPGQHQREVRDIETSQPGLGIEGIKNWRSQKLKRQSASPKKDPG